MREAIDQFHREALAGAQFQANQQQAGAGTQPQPNPQQNQNQAVNIFADPRVRVYITDQTIFTADNVDRYPPDLETLVKGVDVLPITAGALNRRGNANVTALEAAQSESTIPKPKIYLRRIPVDPITGKAEWDFRSCYDTSDSTSWGGENIFDVHSKSTGTALNGEKYNDW
jgi:general secretion pathway protein G